jgi:hypothetical protein
MSSNSSSPIDLEEAFSLIHQGKDFVAVDAHWDAAEVLDKASEILQGLAGAEETNDKKDDDNEKKKIVALYQSQSREYFHRARDCLLTAMKDENASDQVLVKEGDTDAGAAVGEVEDPVYLTLSDEDAEKRLKIFARLFSRETLLSVVGEATNVDATTVDGDDGKPVLEQQCSLEDRLMQLNASLPSGFKTSTERMQDINRGLNRLGMSLHSAADSKPALEIEKSEIDQVADIIQQAKDELAMQPVVDSTSQPVSGVSGSTGAGIIDEDAILLMNDEDEEDNDGSDDDDDIKNEMDVEDVTAIREKVVEAQAKLAEIIALLDIDEEATDGAGHVTIQNQGPGKKALREARLFLQQAGQKWVEYS